MARDQVGQMLWRFEIEDGERPQVDWDRFADVVPTGEHHYACVYDSDADVIHLNRNFPSLVQAVRHFDERFPDLDEATVRDVVERVYGDEMVTRVMMAQALGGELGWDDVFVVSMLSPPALTFAVLGIVSETNSILTKLGGLAGARRGDR